MVTKNANLGKIYHSIGVTNAMSKQFAVMNVVISVCAHNIGVGSSDLDCGFAQQGDSSAKGSSVRNAHSLFLVLTLLLRGVTASTFSNCAKLEMLKNLQNWNQQH